MNAPKTVLFASDMRLDPGQWPEKLELQGILFKRDMPIHHAGEFGGYYYVPVDGHLEILVVLND